MWAAKLAGGTSIPKSSTEAVPLSMRRGFKGCILGVDPSLRGTGFAVVMAQASNRMELLESRSLKLPAKLSSAECLGEIVRSIAEILNRHPVEHIAVEETIYVQNFRTAQILGTARGAAIGLAASRGYPVYEYAPLRIKQAVAGFGRASKEQVSRQIQALLSLPEALPFDESDASAVAVCHALSWAGA